MANNLVEVELLVDLEGVDDVIGEVGAEGGAASRAVVVDEERGGSTGELEEVEEVEADGAFDGGVGDLEQVDYGGSIVLMVNADHETQLPSGAGVLDCPPPHAPFVFL